MKNVWDLHSVDDLVMCLCDKMEKKDKFAERLDHEAFYIKKFLIR